MQQLSLKRKICKIIVQSTEVQPWKSTEENNQTICKHPQENKVVADNVDC